MAITIRILINLCYGTDLQVRLEEANWLSGQVNVHEDVLPGSERHYLNKDALA